ncbi:APC family permease [Paraphotobacterium marinum]
MTTRKNLSSFAIFAASVSGMIGSGWLLGPLSASQVAGPASILTWIIGGALISVVAFCFALLAKNLPTTGGTVRFFQISHGHFAGFCISWITWVAWAAVPTIEAFAVLQCSSSFIPHLWTKGASPHLTEFGIMFGICIVISMAMINIAGNKIFNKTNYIILILKFVIPVGTIFFLFFSHNEYNLTSNFTEFTPNGWQAVFSALPLAGIIYSFLGFNPAIELSKEVKDPMKAVPKALLLSLLFTTLLYTILQAAFIYALPNNSYANGWSHLTFSGVTAPIQGLLTLLGVTFFVKVLYLESVITPFGTGLVIGATTSRMTCAMSENGYIPKKLSHFNQKGTPVKSIVFNTIIAIIYLFTFSSWKSLVGLLVACLTLGYIVGPLALGLLTAQNKILFKVHHKKYIHALCTIALTICTLIVYWAGWNVVQKIGLLIISGYLILGIMCLLNRKKMGNLNIIKGSWILVYFLGLCIFSYLGTFGGMAIIPFGIDVVYISFFSIGIYLLSLKLSKIKLSEKVSKAQLQTI